MRETIQAIVPWDVRVLIKAWIEETSPNIWNREIAKAIIICTYYLAL
jgi:hypothetical protein